MSEQTEFENLNDVKKPELQLAYLLKNDLYKSGIAVHATGEAIKKEIDASSVDVDELFLNAVVLESNGLWLWKGYVHYPYPDDEPVFETISIEKIPYSTMDNL